MVPPTVRGSGAVLPLAILAAGGLWSPGWRRTCLPVKIGASEKQARPGSIPIRQHKCDYTYQECERFARQSPECLRYQPSQAVSQIRINLLYLTRGPRLMSAK